MKELLGKQHKKEGEFIDFRWSMANRTTRNSSIMINKTIVPQHTTHLDHLTKKILYSESKIRTLEKRSIEP